MTDHDDTNRDDRRERYNKRRDDAVHGSVEDTPHRRRAPYKREHVDYDHYLQEEALEDDWFEQNI